MEYKEYVGKEVKVELTNSEFYKGKLISCDEKYIEIEDRTGRFVRIHESMILLFRVVSQ